MSNLFKPTPRMLRQFAAAWLAFFLILSAVALWKRHNPPMSSALAVVALLGIAGLMKPNLARVPFIVASCVTYPIGWLVSQIVLALLFYGVITPIGFFLKIRGRDVLQLRGESKQSSFWIKRGPPPAPDRYLKPF